MKGKDLNKRIKEIQEEMNRTRPPLSDNDRVRQFERNRAMVELKRQLGEEINKEREFEVKMLGQMHKQKFALSKEQMEQIKKIEINKTKEI